MGPWPRFTVLRRAEAHATSTLALGVEDLAAKVDLVLAFAVVHELSDAGRFFAEVRPTLARPRLLDATPEPVVYGGRTVSP